MSKERPGAVRKANAFVRAKEQTDLEEWAYDAQEATHRAEGCGCHQCRIRAEKKQEKFVKESHRVNVWQPDQEEKWIMDQAINNNLLTDGGDQ